MRPKGSPEILESRRQQAIALLKQDRQPVEVARMLGVDRRSVRRWKSAYLQKGKNAIKAKPAGRPRKLPENMRKMLEKKLLKGARASGFQTDLWSCPRVAQLIDTLCGVRYHVDHIGRLLHSMGWSPQRPQRRAVERDEKEIQRWVRDDWPRIKKKPLV
jgi:transposase